MSDNLEEKKQRLKELLSKSDEVGIENVKEELKDLLDSFSPLDLPEIEQELVDEGKTSEEISKLCDIHVELFKESLENRVDPKELKEGHPLLTLIRENTEIINDSEQLNLLFKSLKSAKDEGEREEVAKKFQENVQKLLEIDRTHYEKLEMLAFPHIERRGISSVPRVLWKKHNENMTNLKKLNSLLAKKQFNSETIAQIETIANDLSSSLTNMVFREENILFPTLNELLKKQEWSAIKSQENEIGFYGGVEPGEEWEKTDEYIFPNQLEKGVSEEKFKELPGDLRNVIGQEVPQKIEFGEKDEEDVELDTGYLNEKELNLIFKNLPVDLTFIDKNDRVRFFSDKNRIFLRSRSIIGRPVKYCHPPGSVEVVEKILKEFKDGERDEAEFWIQMGEDFVYISYHAIFDDDDKYVGALEVTQEISKLRDLEGQQTLLDWK